MPARHKSLSSWLVATLTAFLIVMLPPSSRAEEFLELPGGSKVDLSQKCPVCGMVIGGPDRQGVTVTCKDGRVFGFQGIAAAVFKDGHVVGFDGASCLFVYNSIPQKYDVDVRDIRRQFVTDFVSKKISDLSKTFLVLGSNVKGPMGYELIPFISKEEAARFSSENEGKWIVQLHEVGKGKVESPEAVKKEPSSETDVQEQKPTQISPQERRLRSYPQDEGYRYRGGGHHHGH